MASVKRPETTYDDDDQPNFKKPKLTQALRASQTHTFKQRVLLNPADCDLDFNVEGNGLRGSALYEDGFAYCWSGARANIGIVNGNYYFGCKVISAQAVDIEDIPFDQRNICRIGISKGDQKVNNLGESQHSFGYDSTAKLCSSGNIFDYGVKFGVGDTILCAVSICNGQMVHMGFSVNGNWLGYKHFDTLHNSVAKSPWDQAAFPHVLLKNVVVQLQFSVEDGLPPLQGYRTWDCAIQDAHAVMGPAFGKTEDCEVIMLVGLPASGKTTWAQNLVKQNSEKRYVLLGADVLFDKIKVPPLVRKLKYGDMCDYFGGKAIHILNTLVSRASKIPRNFIIDERNVTKNARKSKLKPFSNYQKIAVVVFPRPEELKPRALKRFNETDKNVPDDNLVNKLIASFSLPTSKNMPCTDEYFDQVVFTELDRAEVQKHLDEMKANLILKHNDHASQYQQVASGASSCLPLPAASSGFLPRDDLNHCRSYIGYDSKRNEVGGTACNAVGTSGGHVSNYCQSGMAEPYPKPSSFGSNNFSVLPQVYPLVPGSFNGNSDQKPSSNGNSPMQCEYPDGYSHPWPGN